MGWRGAVRSIGAAVRAAERDAIRRQKAELKAAIATDAADAVAALEHFQQSLVSIHTKLADPIDWSAMAAAPKPVEPRLSDEHARNARNALANFQPSIFDIFKGGSKKLRAQLEAAVARAPAEDQVAFEVARQAYVDALREWEADTALARNLIAGDVAATKSVLEEMQAGLQGDGYIGTRITYHIERGYLLATPVVHGVDVIPAYRRKQLASGRLSQTKRPIGEFNELYQDYVASVALKVAGDVFRILPIAEVYVTCETEMLNPSTGLMENTPILSVQFVRPTFERLNLTQIDPSNALINFRHAMAFKRAQGMSRIEPLVPAASG